MIVSNRLKQLEEALLTTAMRKDPEQVAALLAEDFREFGSSGRTFSKAAILKELQTEPTNSQLTLSDFSCSMLSAEIALVTYRTVSTTSAATPLHANRSSIWALRDDRWQIVFHQGTPVPE